MKVQDLFVKPDGNKLLDTPLLMQIVELPTEPVIETSQDGTKTYENFYVVLSHQGVLYDFKVSAAQLARIFTNKKKTGEIVWSAKEGDLINFRYASNKSMPQRPYYAAEPADGLELTPTIEDTVNDVFGDNTPVAEKKKFVPTKAAFGRKTEETKWDGTPRQGNFRAGLAGMLQAIICNPNMNPENVDNRETAKEIAVELMLWVRDKATELEATTQD